MPTCYKIPSTPAPLPRQTHSTMIIKFMFVRNQPADNSKRRKEKNEPRRLPTDKPAPMPNTLYSSPKKMHTYLVIKAVYICHLQTLHRFAVTSTLGNRILTECSSAATSVVANSLGGFALVPAIWFNQSVSNSKYQLLKLVLALFMSQQAISVAIIIMMPQFLPYSWNELGKCIHR